MAGEIAFERQLIRDGVLDEARLAKARQDAASRGVALPEALVQAGVATADTVYRSLADFCEMRFVSPSKMDIPVDVVSKVPARFATHYNFVPVQERNGTIVVAVSDPLNHQLLDDIRLVLKKQRVEIVVATPDEISRAKKSLYGVGADTVERILSESDSVANVVSLDAASAGTDLGDDNLDASIIKFVNELFAEAIRTGATDIHLEPFEDQLRLRYRIDGILHGVPTPPSIRGFHPAIVSRVKIMANLNIAEKRLPQDGKIRASLGEEQFDLRVSVLPTPHGETVNLRILNRSSMFMTLEQLGFTGKDLELFNTFLTRPHGMILVTGPTGSGKTTTLYAALSKLNKLEHKIITIEDPIEYQLKGITQMQTAAQIGFDFSSALRSMLRHDPDVMLVGEIRDYETAEMAIRSSLTGHLVFSTLHTNDAAGAVTRLTDMGVEPFLIASTMIASLAQRLVRCICKHCAEDYTPNAADFAELGRSPEDAKGATFKRGRGCDACRHTGYHGRIAIYEMLPFTNEIKEMTIRREPSTRIKRRAIELGMRTLRDSGWQRVCDGRTTFEEVMRVTAEADVFDDVAV
ncbi:MAG: Flp pilus assembly complex ATPase component TadA [Candidatus Hydrogenedentes bacterium]|nr:Flp pilus assembly complex ATPase component TadA [Candidatus Hydrogenedentota bacterium]